MRSGKAQRVIAELRAAGHREPIYLHGALEQDVPAVRGIHDGLLPLLVRLVFVNASYSRHMLIGAVEIDRLMVTGGAQLGDYALRLAQRIGADQHAASGWAAGAPDSLAISLRVGGWQNSGNPEAPR